MKVFLTVSTDQSFRPPRLFLFTLSYKTESFYLIMGNSVAVVLGVTAFFLILIFNANRNSKSKASFKVI